MILSPVDAELGRGNSQIQIQTRSGTNRFTRRRGVERPEHGVKREHMGQQQAGHPRTGEWSPLAPNWRNVHEYTLTSGGPHCEEQNVLLSHCGTRTSPSCARRQCSRAHKRSATGECALLGRMGRPERGPVNNPTSFATAAAAGQSDHRIRSISQENPRPPLMAGWHALHRPIGLLQRVRKGKTRWKSVQLRRIVPGGVDSAGKAYNGVAMTSNRRCLDPKRPTQFDPRGYFAKTLAAMPEANNFFQTSGDGLTMGTDRWLLTRRIGDPVFYNETLIGNDPYSNRKQFNIKIDHN